MNLLGVQLSSGALVCVGLVLWTLLPLFVARRCAARRSSRRKATTTKLALSLANCFAIGVFLATCFYSMVPHLRAHLSRAVKQFGPPVFMSDGHDHGTMNGSAESLCLRGGEMTAWEHAFACMNERPTVELLLLLGFLLTAFIEELLGCCRACCKASRSPSARQPVADPSGFLRRNGVLASSEYVKFRSLTSAAPGPPPGTAEEEHEPLVKLSTSPAHSVGDIHESGTTGEHETSMEHRRENGGWEEHDELELIKPDGFAETAPPRDDISFRSVALLFGLSIHNVFEGLALGLQDSVAQYLKILTGILAHELLCALAFGIMQSIAFLVALVTGITLAEQRVRTRNAVLLAAVYISCIPLGMIVGLALAGMGEGPGSSLTRIFCEGISTGTFIYVATVELFAGEFHGDGGGHSHHGGAHAEEHSPEGGHHHSHDETVGFAGLGLLKLVFVVIGCVAFMLVLFTWQL